MLVARLSKTHSAEIEDDTMNMTIYLFLFSWRVLRHHHLPVQALVQRGAAHSRQDTTRRCAQCSYFLDDGLHVSLADHVVDRSELCTNSDQATRKTRRLMKRPGVPCQVSRPVNLSFLERHELNP